ncbi:MAG TPA: hypothetical protein VK983_04955 [Candidatus Limnocylindrales bacterium]|nr:hypothetical protein [Candidatus Limnocylindrales bacterium]
MTHEIQPSYSMSPDLNARHAAAIQNYGEALMEEQAYREDQASWGVIDLGLAAKGSLIATTLGETVQDEHEAAVAAKQALEESLPGSDIGSTLLYDPDSTPIHPIEWMAQAPVDMKAFGVAVGAFALVSAAHRIRRAERFPREAQEAVAQAEQADKFTPANVEDRKRYRIGRRLGDAAITTVATIATYQAAKYGTETQDIVAATALNVTAVGSVLGSKLRTKLAVRKFRQQRADRMVNPAELE